jgi:ketosteroid isomerase-like protein
VREVLAQFSNGYQRLDAAAVRRLWPGAPATLRESFADMRSYQLTFENMQISVRGDTATVTTVRRIKAQPQAGRLQETNAPTTFTLRRAGGGWVIDSVR